MSKVRVAILTISDGVSTGHREDTSGQAIRDISRAEGWNVVKSAIVPDDVKKIRRYLLDWADGALMDLVITTGGTGLGPRDVSPEATLEVIERLVPGIAEYMRSESIKTTPFGMLSRGIVGTRKRCLIVNLPGSPKAVQECLLAIKGVLPHAIELMRGDVTQHLVAGSAVINTKLNAKLSGSLPRGRKG